MTESAQTPEDRNDDAPAAETHSGDAAKSSDAARSSKAKAPSSKASAAQQGASKTGRAKRDAFKPDASEDNATEDNASEENASEENANGDDADVAASSQREPGKTQAGDASRDSEGTDGGATADGSDDPTAGSESDGGEQAATDEAFEAIVDGVEFDPVDGAAYGAVVKERDEYLAALQRLKAEFDNHRRRSSEQATTQREQAAAGLVEKLLPVLDALDAADAHELEAVRPIRQQFLEALTTSGLTRLHPDGESFDPEQHEAVMHEAGEEDEPQVTEVLRTGYAWNGRVLRPAMVKVRG